MTKAIELKRGQTFGRLRVINRAENDKHGKSRYLCYCQCGNKCFPSASSLLSGKSRSCGCMRQFALELCNAKKFADLEGRRFGRLKVIEMLFRRGKKHIWLCRCACGQTKVVEGRSLKQGYSTSCGCLTAKLQSRINKKLVKNRTRNKNGQFLSKYDH